MTKVFLIRKPDGEAYCVAKTRELAVKIVKTDCATGDLTCDGLLTPEDVDIEEICFHESW